MKKPSELDRFFQNIVGLIEEHRSDGHPGDSHCWDGTCKCNEKGHWYALYSLVKEFWKNAPDVNANWEARAKVHYWNPTELHELLVAALLGQTPKVRNIVRDPDGRMWTWGGEPIIGADPQKVQQILALHQVGVVNDKEVRDFLFPPVTFTVPPRIPSYTFGSSAQIIHRPFDVEIEPSSGLAPANVEKSETHTPPVNQPTQTPQEKAARRRWEWQNDP